jgi:tetratricopeptide (TPR) repeat protein
VIGPRRWIWGLGIGAFGLIVMLAWWFQPHRLSKPADGIRLFNSKNDRGRQAFAPTDELDPRLQQVRRVAHLLIAGFALEPRALYLAGQVHYQLGETDAAVRLWQDCLRQDPRFRDARIAIGMLMFESGEFAEAEQMLIDAFLQAPADPQASFLLASALLKQGKLDDTEQVLRASLSIQPDSVPNQVLLGQVLLQQKRSAEAKESFLTASRLAPEYANAWFGLAAACAQLGQQDEAVQHREMFQHLQRKQLREEIEQAKDYDDQQAMQQDLAVTCAAAGRWYLERGDDAQAEQHWQLALQLDDSNPEASLDLVRLYLQKDLPERALASLLPLQETRAQEVGFWLQLGQLHARLDDFQQADQAFARAAELAPETGAADAARADLRIRMQRDLEHAVRFARNAVQRQESGDHYYLLSVACQATGDLPAARQAAQRAIELQPGDPLYRQWYLSIQAER